MHPILLLWDIDGTLISSGGAGEEALRQALLNQFGIIDDLADIEIAGRTDSAISTAICRKHQGHGFTPDELLEAYLELLPALLFKKRGRVCPGVREFLDWAHRHPEVHNALLTGNTKKGAQLKLKHYGLDEFFEFGAFSDDSPNRNHLGPIVLERARTRLKKDFHLQSTWVIGDTPHDIACGRALGCKVLAVATGRHSLDELKSHSPNLAVADLSDFQEIILHWEMI